MSQTIEAVLFDFDGTLAPNLDLPDMRRQVIALTQTNDVPETVYADRYIVEIIDAATSWLHERAPRKARAYYDSAQQLIYDIEIEAARSTSLFDGVDTYLHTLRTAGLAVGVVTRNCRAALLTVCPDLLQCVDTVRARDDVTHIKPDPRHLAEALADLNCPPQRAAMVGDGALDMHCGKAAGLYCVGVESGSNDAARLSEAGADEVHRMCFDYRPDHTKP